MTSAQQLLDDDAQLLTSAAATAARAHVGFVRSKLLAASGRLTDSWAALKDALGRVEGNVGRYGDRLRTLATRLLLESCDQQLFLGEFGAANAQLTKAERIADGVRSLASTLRFDLMLDRWMLKWAEANADARSLRLRQYESLRKIAASSGSVASPKRSIHLARAFMLYAESDEQEMALDWARRSLRMARVQPGRRAAASAALEVAEWLSTTAMWRRIPGLLGLAEGVFVEGTSDWAFLEGLWVVYFLEAGRYRDAWVRAKALERATEGTGNRRFQGAVQTKVAVAAHFLGKRDEAGDYIAAAVEMTERYGTPWTKRDADRAAAMIRG